MGCRHERVILTAGLAVAALARPAVAGPDLSVAFGGTFAVHGAGIQEGGTAISGAALWPFADRLRFGVSLSAHDLGSRIGRLTDPNDGTDLGAVEIDHRDVWGGGWRLDALASPRAGWTPYATGEWGAYRIEDDRRGKIQRALSSTGFTLGAGIGRALGSHGRLGAALRYHRFFNDVAGRHVSAAVEWQWTSRDGGVR